MQNYIFVATSLILVYIIYLIRQIVSNFSFFVFQMWFVCKLLYKCIKMLLFIAFSIKKVNSFVVTSLHQVEYKFTLRTCNIESKISLKCVVFEEIK